MRPLGWKYHIILHTNKCLNCPSLAQAQPFLTLGAVVRALRFTLLGFMSFILVGNDLRKAVVDGWPVENGIASDLRSGLILFLPIFLSQIQTSSIVPEFWECGHELFKSTSETFPAAFVPGDAFNPALIEPREPFSFEPTTPRPTDLRTLKSLTPLQGHISAIHVSSFFHLFGEEEQLKLAKQLATLLSPLQGSIIFGMHSGQPRTEVFHYRGSHIFCHSPESWADLWDGEVFKKGSVEVQVKLTKREPRKLDPPGITMYWLIWSVIRLWDISTKSIGYVGK